MRSLSVRRLAPRRPRRAPTTGASVDSSAALSCLRVARSVPTARHGLYPWRLLESFPIMAVMRKDSLARIAPSETTIGPPSTTARHLVNASLSDNTRRAYAGALG